MKYLNVHGKLLSVPSFFQVYNFGGGAADKYREIVYADLTDDTPALFNYYYLEYGKFGKIWLKNLHNYNLISDFLNSVRYDMITNKNYISKQYEPKKYDFGKKVFLLDSGASNLIKQIGQVVDFNEEKFYELFLKFMKAYYDFADKYKFDIVIGFDLGGKYTYKDGEADQRLINFYNHLDKDKINICILEESIKYIQNKKSYYPYILATIHGETPEKYEKYTRKILYLESKYHFHFWGFALGGIASTKNLNASWFKGIDYNRTGVKSVKNATLPAVGTKIVYNLVGNRPIHALGCGGYPNIPMNYFFGATSFDAASPARRAGDGNKKSVERVYDKYCAVSGFSKIFVGGYRKNIDKYTLYSNDIGYINLNKVDDNFPLCGCMACKEISSYKDIKDLYHEKLNNKDEEFYFARQLMNIHAIWQHRFLCNVISKYRTMEEFVNNNPNQLFQKLLIIYNQVLNLY